MINEPSKHEITMYMPVAAAKEWQKRTRVSLVNLNLCLDYSVNLERLGSLVSGIRSLGSLLRLQLETSKMKIILNYE